MPFNGSGSFSVSPADFPAVTGTTISSTKYNNSLNDIASGLSGCITKDGQTTVTADIPLAGYKLTGIGTATQPGDAVNITAAQNSAYRWGGNASGSANDIAIAPSPAITAYTAGQIFLFRATYDNTGAATINVNGVGAVNLLKGGGTALVGGELEVNHFYFVLGTGLNFVLVGSSKCPPLRPATTTEMAAATDTDIGVVTPGRVKYCPTVAKVHINCNAAGSILNSEGVSSITDVAVGIVQINFSTNFASIAYTTTMGADAASSLNVVSDNTSRAVGSTRLNCYNLTPALADPVRYNAAFYGDL